MTHLGDELNGEEESAPSRKWDRELLAMAALLRTLEDLSEPARARVVAWLSSRHAESLEGR